ncbi:hypothetical protein NECAME_06126 [Necator americanus]|uniref:Uncharacterized protein n=1 Tax=Necator americanus TaxID=51031 RepID=W2TY34_NECAM|nr:hypothetical protein NECAME_06126 [Necator americanus]ETN85961.1 hypothetical protein NECAME_06126 [Necator americanus]
MEYLEQKKICDLRGNVQKVNNCQRWIRQVSSGEFDLSDNDRAGRPDSDSLKSLARTDPKLITQEIANALQGTWSRSKDTFNQFGGFTGGFLFIPIDGTFSEGLKLKKIDEHDNAKARTARLTQRRIRQLNWEVLPHPPCTRHDTI